jgi:hypothetical protein
MTKCRYLKRGQNEDEIKLKNMSASIKSLAQNNSASRIADIVIKIASKEKDE